MWLVDGEIRAHQAPVAGEGADEGFLAFFLGEVDKFLGLHRRDQGAVGQHFSGYTAVIAGHVGILFGFEARGGFVTEISNDVGVGLVDHQRIVLGAAGGGVALDAEDDAVALLDVFELFLVGGIKDKLHLIVDGGGDDR